MRPVGAERRSFARRRRADPVDNRRTTRPDPRNQEHLTDRVRAGLSGSLTLHRREAGQAIETHSAPTMFSRTTMATLSTTESMAMVTRTSWRSCVVALNDNAAPASYPATTQTTRAVRAFRSPMADTAMIEVAPRSPDATAMSSSDLQEVCPGSRCVAAVSARMSLKMCATKSTPPGPEHPCHRLSGI